VIGGELAASSDRPKARGGGEGVDNGGGETVRGLDGTGRGISIGAQLAESVVEPCTQLAQLCLSCTCFVKPFWLRQIFGQLGNKQRRWVGAEACRSYGNGVKMESKWSQNGGQRNELAVSMKICIP
jgi:hypothetical protein